MMKKVSNSALYYLYGIIVTPVPKASRILTEKALGK